ncbi:MAG: hypothetical protein IKL46_05000 [Clostridia bacterium]|nr:hypothetical protein [Clostridia bacterium]
MKKTTKVIAVIIAVILMVCTFASCTSSASAGSREDKSNTIEVANKLQENQPTPTDIDYSLERYNLIRRAYWVNGQREKANALPCEIEKPLGYIVLFGESGTVIGSFIVDGKVSSLNSFLTPDSEYYEQHRSSDESAWLVSDNNWLSDVDGSYGENDNGIFFFTPDGKYIEWTGTYLYSDIPFEVENPVLKVSAGNE